MLKWLCLCGASEASVCNDLGQFAAVGIELCLTVRAGAQFQGRESCGDAV